MNILLLQPNKINHIRGSVSSYPLGLGYIAASLDRMKVEVGLLDCYLEDPTHAVPIPTGNGIIYKLGLSDEEIKKRVARIRPDVIGITIPFSMQLKSALDVADLVKDIDNNIILIAGGAHVSAMPESLDHSAFDYLVIGEGEQVFPGLIRAIEDNTHDYTAIPGICYRDGNGRFISNTPRELIVNLDEISFPAYDLMPFTKIWTHRKPYANIIATRGCPHHCVFCSIHAVMGKKIRRRSIENVLEEIDILVKQYKIKELYFEDDNLTADVDWAKELFECLCRRSYPVELGFRNGIRADRVDIELLKLMQKAGCARVCFAPESGNQKILDNIVGKKLKLSDVEKAVASARKIGLNVSCFFVIGMPGETKEDIDETIQFARNLKKLGCDVVDINCAVPYPGTRLYKTCIQKNYIDSNLDWSKLHTHESIINTPEFRADSITGIRANIAEDLKETRTEKIFRHVQNFSASPLVYIRKFISKIVVPEKSPAGLAKIGDDSSLTILTAVSDENEPVEKENKD